MRKVVSVVIASILFLFIFYLAISGYIVMSDFWTGLSIALIPIALGILYWGFKPQISKRFKKNKKPEAEIKKETKSEPVEIEAKAIGKQKKLKKGLLPDNTDITELNIDEEFLDEIYSESQNQAIKMFHDAKLSTLSIQVFPFHNVTDRVNIYFYFYSKWADKRCTFSYRDAESQVKHWKPNTRIKHEFQRHVFKTLPWKESPQWIHFLKRAFDKKKPFHPALSTSYHLIASAYSKPSWSVDFDDEFSGNDFEFKWDGQGLGENNITEQ